MALCSTPGVCDAPDMHWPSLQTQSPLHQPLPCPPCSQDNWYLQWLIHQEIQRAELLVLKSITWVQSAQAWAWWPPQFTSADGATPGKTLRVKWQVAEVFFVREEFLWEKKSQWDGFKSSFGSNKLNFLVNNWCEPIDKIVHVSVTKTSNHLHSISCMTTQFPCWSAMDKWFSDRPAFTTTFP